MERDDFMAEKNGYVYINSCFSFLAGSNIQQHTARYVLSNPDDLIVYIKKSEGKNQGIGGISVNSNVYYILGKGGDTAIKGSAFRLYTRGERYGAYYDSEQMDGFQYSGAWDLSGNYQYGMGGGGTNGIINYDYQCSRANGFPSNFPILKNNSETTVQFGSVPDISKPFIGFIDSQLSNLDIQNYVNYPERERGSNLMTKDDYMNNVYSSKYYKYRKDNVVWWTDFQDIRNFYKNNQLYFDQVGGDVIPIVPDEDFADNYFVMDGYPLFLNLHTTHNLTEAQKYLADGTLPSDDTYTESDDGNPKVGKDDDSGGDDDDMDGMTNTSHTNAQSILNSPTSHYYVLDNTQLTNFTNWFWNDILTTLQEDYTTLGDMAYNLLTNAYGDLNQYVTSLRKLNVNYRRFFQVTNNDHIQLGRYSLDTMACTSITHDTESMPLLAEIQVPMRHAKDNKPTFGNFLDYPPYTSVSIYIPFIGIVPIDGNMVVGRTIRLYGAVDVIAGTIHYNVFVQTPSKDWSLIGSYEGKCGVDIPLALDNSMQNSTNILKTVADVTTGLCTKSPSSLLNIGNGIFTEPISNLGAQTTNTTYFNPNRCALIIQSAIGTVPSNFGRVTGYTWCESATLSELSGLTICKNPRIGKFDNGIPTVDERQEIYSLLENGVII